MPNLTSHMRPCLILLITTISRSLLVKRQRYVIRLHSPVTSISDLTIVKVTNIFDDLPSLSAPKLTELRDELACYLSTDPEQVKDVLLWWHEHKAMYPRLSRMALDYLTIPGKPRTMVHQS